MGEIQTFGQWLRHRRRELDLTQGELSQRVGCAPITIRKIEADEMRPSKQLAALLIEQLGVAPEKRDDFVHFAAGENRPYRNPPPHRGSICLTRSAASSAASAR